MLGVYIRERSTPRSKPFLFLRTNQDGFRSFDTILLTGIGKNEKNYFGFSHPVIPIILIMNRPSPPSLKRNASRSRISCTYIVIRLIMLFFTQVNDVLITDC